MVASLSHVQQICSVYITVLVLLKILGIHNQRIDQTIHIIGDK